MSNSTITTPNSTNNVPNDSKKIKPLKAYTILVSYTVILFIIGVMVGKLFFWNNYNNTPLAERQISTLQNKLKSNPKDPKVLTDLGWSYFQKGDYNQALAYYKQAIDIDAKYYPAHLNLGLAYSQEKKYELAIEALKKSSSLSPNSPAPHLNLGVVYIKTGKFEEAINELTLADKASPGNVETICQLGLAYEKMQKFDEAAQQYNDALRFDPKYTQAQEGLNRIKGNVSK